MTCKPTKNIYWTLIVPIILTIIGLSWIWSGFRISPINFPEILVGIVWTAICLYTSSYYFNFYLNENIQILDNQFIYTKSENVWQREKTTMIDLQSVNKITWQIQKPTFLRWQPFVYFPREYQQLIFNRISDQPITINLTLWTRSDIEKITSYIKEIYPNIS